MLNINSQQGNANQSTIMKYLMTLLGQIFKIGMSKEVEKLEPLYIANRNVKCQKSLAKHSDSSSKALHT